MDATFKSAKYNPFTAYTHTHFLPLSLLACIVHIQRTENSIFLTLLLGNLPQKCLLRMIHVNVRVNISCYFLGTMLTDLD